VGQVIHLDSSKTRLYQVYLYNEKDDKLWKDRIKQKFITEKSAKEMMTEFWQEVLLKEYNETGNKIKLTIAKESLKKAVYDEMENLVYVPVVDEVHKDYFEQYILVELKEFLEEKFGINNIIVEIINIENKEDN